MHHVAFTGARPESLDRMPTHMFEVRQQIPTDVSAAGWHVAHIYNAQDRNTDWPNWSRRELVRRFIRNVHPCNCFYIPKPDWQRYGGDPQVIAFFAAQYARRYAAVWEEFLGLAGAEPLLPAAGESLRYIYPLEGVAAGLQLSSGVAVSYRYSRLCFRAALIEPLGWDEAWHITSY